MELTPLVEQLRAEREVWLPDNLSVRQQRRVARSVVHQVPATMFEQLDPKIGIHAYGEPTPGTMTRIYLPAAPSYSAGAVIPSR
jgi:hypothetical protein